MISMIQVITPQRAKEIMDTETDCYILDVRTPGEYVQGHILKSISIPLAELPEKAEGIIPDKEKKVLVYCKSGIRAGQAAMILERLGYRMVFNFGRIVDWPFETTQD